MITYIIIGITALASMLCFQNPHWMIKYQFNAYKVVHGKEYYRLFTHAFIHANWMHLIVNMLVLFFFGPNVEYFFKAAFGKHATVFFIALYVGGILFSNLWSIKKQKDNYNYNAVGASGAVMAVLFTFIFFDPWEMLYFFGIIPIPGIIFGVGYLIYTYRMAKQNRDYIAHDAHLLGAIYGFVFPLFLKPNLFYHFIHSLIPNF